MVVEMATFSYTALLAEARFRFTKGFNQSGVVGKAAFLRQRILCQREHEHWLLCQDSIPLFPGFDFFTALVTSMVTVPVLGLGIKPLGPKNAAEFPDAPSVSGVATRRQIQTNFFLDFFDHIFPHRLEICAGSFGFFGFSFGEYKTERSAAGAVRGEPQAPLTCWSAWRGSRLRRTANSTVSSNLAVVFFLVQCIRFLGSLQCFPADLFGGVFRILPCLGISLPPMWYIGLASSTVFQSIKLTL